MPDLAFQGTLALLQDIPPKGPGISYSNHVVKCDLIYCFLVLLH